jgi:aspartyl-tRNA(Asn)/glutamyl-tRNA(Gln) amidotransferase subunit A
VPFAVKDLVDTEGVVTTYGSAMFEGHVPREDATAVRLLRRAGAILVGKTQLHEFAWGITSVNERMGSSRNPWAPDRIPGGSSGGSAVALAARDVPLALGTDTGGSIRIPASFCGVAGFKPSYGRVGLAGVWPLAPSLDHAGPMARTPGDARLALRALCGDDPGGDTEVVPEGVRVGACADLHLVPLGEDVGAALGDALRTLQACGAELVETSFPEAGLIVPTFATVQRAEALHVHRRAGLYPERRGEYGEDVRDRLEQAQAETLASYLDAAASRRLLCDACTRLFREIDFLVTPVTACPPPRIGDDVVHHLGEPRSLRDVVMPFTALQDLAGLPACALRAGFDADGIPVGVQITGPPGADGLVLAAAAALFDATPELQASWPCV